MLKRMTGLAIVAGGLCLLGWKQVSPPNAGRPSATTTTCMSNQKQIALGLMMYVQDYDEKFPSKATSYKTQVMPYIKNEQVFHCPLDTPSVASYTFNPNLAGVTIGSVVSVPRTVLLYEGKNMQIDFRHEGSAVIAFADGHVKLTSPDAAKNLFWYPAGKTPKPAVRPVGKNKGKTGK